MEISNSSKKKENGMILTICRYNSVVERSSKHAGQLVFV